MDATADELFRSLRSTKRCLDVLKKMSDIGERRAALELWLYAKSKRLKPTEAMRDICEAFQLSSLSDSEQRVFLDQLRQGRILDCLIRVPAPAGAEWLSDVDLLPRNPHQVRTLCRACKRAEGDEQFQIYSDAFFAFLSAQTIRGKEFFLEQCDDVQFSRLWNDFFERSKSSTAGWRRKVQFVQTPGESGLPPTASTQLSVAGQNRGKSRVARPLQ